MVDTTGLVRAALLILRGNPSGFPSTRSDADLHTRLVQHLRVDDDCGVWVGTSPGSRKAAEIRRDPAVTVAVEDRGRFAFATVVGRAGLVTDHELRQEVWREGDLAPFFPAGPLGDDFVLVHVRADRLELMDFAAGIHPDPFGPVPVAVVRSGDGWAPA